MLNLNLKIWGGSEAGASPVWSLIVAMEFQLLWLWAPHFLWLWCTRSGFKKHMEGCYEGPEGIISIIENKLIPLNTKKKLEGLLYGSVGLDWGIIPPICVQWWFLWCENAGARLFVTVSETCIWVWCLWIILTRYSYFPSNCRVWVRHKNTRRSFYIEVS